MFDRDVVAKELVEIAKLMTPMSRKARLLSRHEKILDKWAKSSQGERELSKGFVSYDDLPSSLTSALERVKDTETLWSDVERYLGDIAMSAKAQGGGFFAKEAGVGVITADWQNRLDGLQMDFTKGVRNELMALFGRMGFSAKSRAINVFEFSDEEGDGGDGEVRIDFQGNHFDSKYHIRISGGRLKKPKYFTTKSIRTMEPRDVVKEVGPDLQRVLVSG